MKEFLLDPKFLIPFLSTLGASCTILAIHTTSSFFKTIKRKIYAIAYMTDVTVRLLQSSLIIQGKTILPHIEATKRILKGDFELLEKTLLGDEFDILTDSPMCFNHLPEEYKVLIGYDNLRLVQCFETILYLHENESKRKHFNEFVKINLKAMLAFQAKNQQEKEDILNTYWDYLSSLEHEENRIIAMIVHIFLPYIRKYLNKRCFFFCYKNEVHSMLNLSEELIGKNEELIPTTEFFQESVSGGIQKIVK
jgi:hypothetical protein